MSSPTLILGTILTIFSNLYFNYKWSILSIVDWLQIDVARHTMSFTSILLNVRLMKKRKEKDNSKTAEIKKV